MKSIVFLSSVLMSWNVFGQAPDTQIRMQLAFANISIAAGFASDYSALASKEYTCLLIGRLQAQILFAVEKPLEEIGSGANRRLVEAKNVMNELATKLGAYCGPPENYENAPTTLKEVRANLQSIKELAFEAHRM